MKTDLCWVRCPNQSTRTVRFGNRRQMRLCDEHTDDYEAGRPAPTQSGGWPWAQIEKQTSDA